MRVETRSRHVGPETDPPLPRARIREAKHVRPCSKSSRFPGGTHNRGTASGLFGASGTWLAWYRDRSRYIAQPREGGPECILKAGRHGPHGHGGFGHLGKLMGMGSPVRRGDVQPAVIALLKEQDMHGYQIIQELTERSGGAWNPSPGSIYPILQMLEDQGMVTSEKVGGKRVFSLTDAGREYAETLPDQAPWDERPATRTPPVACARCSEA